MTRPITLAMLILVTAGLTAWSALADDPGEAPAPAEQQAPPAKQDEAPKADSSEDVIDDLLERGRPKVAPTQRPTPPARRSQPAGLEAKVEIDPKVIGVAPGGKQPKLRREGDFVISRRGRMTRSGEGGQAMFTFLGDSEASPETPMVLLPCQLLESMEGIVQQRGDNVVFIVSGQVTTYRGANYVLPTMLKVAVDTENLE